MLTIFKDNQQGTQFFNKTGLTLKHLRKCTILLAKGTRSPVEFYLLIPLWELDEWAEVLLELYKEMEKKGGK